MACGGAIHNNTQSLSVDDRIAAQPGPWLGILTYTVEYRYGFDDRKVPVVFIGSVARRLRLFTPGH